MSGVVSYDLFASRGGNSGSGFTSEGGYYETFVNNTGAESIKGTIVVASSTANNGVSIAPAGSVMPIGVIYEDGVDNNAEVKVVVYGKAQVLLKNGEAATAGYWCGVSVDTAGRMYQVSTSPSTSEHNREIGHSLQSAVSGTNVLSLVQLHFN